MLRQFRWCVILGSLLIVASITPATKAANEQFTSHSATAYDIYVDAVTENNSLGENNINKNPINIIGPAKCNIQLNDISLGGGHIIVDMGLGEAIINGSGFDFKVYESDGSCVDGQASNYEVFVSENPNGPWISVGRARGVSSFDIASTGIAKVRFIRINDLSTVDNNAETPGADIDAIETFYTEPPLPCEVSPTTDLDSCLLKPGDLLFVRGTGTFESLIKIGSWWSHVALYVGDEKIVQAAPYDDDVRDVEEVSLRDSDWWRSDANTYVQDWLVLRPKVSDDVKKYIVADAKLWAGPPELIYQTPVLDNAPLDDETIFYCSKLVWRAYYRNGYNLDITRWKAFGLYEKIVTPGDLANSQSEVVQVKDISLPKIIIMVSPLGAVLSENQLSVSKTNPDEINNPAHLLLVDPQGRRTGYDPTVEVIYNEIPGAFYAGKDTPFENISVIGDVKNWQVIVSGAAQGSYQLGAEYVDINMPKQHRITGTIRQGEEKKYIINSANNDIILTTSSFIFLPLIH